MNLLAALLVIVAFVAAALLVLPACRRTALGRWHPEVAPAPEVSLPHFARFVREQVTGDS